MATAAVVDAAPAQFTWDYTKGARPALATLYEKAKQGQWNGETDLPWDTPVDPERQAVSARGFAPSAGPGARRSGRFHRSDARPLDLSGTPLERWGDKEWLTFGMETNRWVLSQFLHGEQGALLCTAKIVETVPWIDAKFYAASQVMDEARHVEVFARYLDDKLGGAYPVNGYLWQLLQDIVADARWDVTYLGTQIMVEGLALAAFGLLHVATTEPLLKQLLRLVMDDEARHVAFGVLTLREVYASLTGQELRDRQQFAYEAARSMRDRLLQEEVWEVMGVDAALAAEVTRRDPTRAVYEQMLFSKIVPNLDKLGLLDACGGWLRERFGEMGVLRYAEDRS